MFSYLKQDLPASIVVFLVALPLCLGIALASGAPLLSGLISGIIGGIVVGLLSESHSSVSGPAAGLAAVVLATITELGSFETFLIAVFLAGALQLIGGIAKVGFIADYVPSNVIKGLLAAIGILLILKQIPHAMGLDRDAEGDFAFWQPDGENTLSELLQIFNFFHWGAVIISALSLLVLVYWDKTPLKKITFFPSSLFVVLLGIVLNGIFQRFIPALYIDASHLVSIPQFETIGAFFAQPDLGFLSNQTTWLSALGAGVVNYKLWIAAITIALVASLETLLNLEAVENIDPRKRKASPNRELIAQGAGNMFAGLFGGIPVTSVIVRSSVNINSGAVTKLSAIVHGVLLFISVLFVSGLLNLIPLASLAAILLVTGYKLAKVSLFKEMYAKGSTQFIPFIATILAIVLTDLLIGILIGLVTAIFFLLKSNYKNPFVLENEQLHMGETLRFELPNQVSFLNKASIKETLWAIPEGSRVIIDASYSDFIDNDVVETITDFKNAVSKEKNIQLNVIGLKDKYQLDDHIQFVNVLDKATQQKLMPSDVLELLKKGNERFVKGKWTEKYLKHQVNATSFGQNPMAVIVSCIDSRTSPEIIFDAGLGDLLSIRIAGNVINEDIIGSIELACSKIGTKLVVVLGHSHCGAVSAAMQGVTDGHFAKIAHKIDRAIAQCQCDRQQASEGSEAHNKVAQQNAHNALEDLLRQSEYLADATRQKTISIVAAFYNTASGEVVFNV